MNMYKMFMKMKTNYFAVVTCQRGLIVMTDK